MTLRCPSPSAVLIRQLATVTSTDFLECMHVHDTNAARHRIYCSRLFVRASRTYLVGHSNRLQETVQCGVHHPYASNELRCNTLAWTCTSQLQDCVCQHQLHYMTVILCYGMIFTFPHLVNNCIQFAHATRLRTKLALLCSRFKSDLGRLQLTGSSVLQIVRSSCE